MWTSQRSEAQRVKNGGKISAGTYLWAHVYKARNFFGFDLQMKIEKPEILFTLQFRWVLAFKEVVILVSITNSKMLKKQLQRKVDFYSYRKITFSDNKLQGQLFRNNFYVCWSSVRRISEQVSNQTIWKSLKENKKVMWGKRACFKFLFQIALSFI